MNDAIETALGSLLGTIKTLPESSARTSLEQQVHWLRKSLQQIAAYADFPKVKRSSLTGSSVAVRNIYERAYRADPRATEMDLLDAGLRDVATDLGAHHLSEEYRRELRAKAAKAELELGDG